MTFRNMTVAAGAMQDAMTFVQWATNRLNTEHGGSFGVSISVGGDPSAIAVASPWETLGAYEATRNAGMADEQLASAMRMSSGLFTSAQDTIGRVLRAPGDRGNYANVNTAMMHMPAMTDAVAFALEVAEFVSANHGTEVGVMNATTGPRAGIMWLSYADSLDELAQLGEGLEADEDYLSFFKRSSDLFVDGSLEQSIWQLL